MLNIEDSRSWFAIAALAVALIFMAGSAHGTLRCGHYGAYCSADAAGAAAKLFRPMENERRHSG